MKETKNPLVARDIAEEASNEPSEIAWDLIDRWKNTGEKVWLTQAALHFIDSREPLPPGIRAYIRHVLIEKEKQESPKKYNTKRRDEWYIREVRDLIFLTGANSEDACHRVSNVNTRFYGNNESVPAPGTLYKLWNNRFSTKMGYHCAEQWKRNPHLKLSYEWAVTWFGEYCKPEYGICLKTKHGLADPVELTINRKLFKQPRRLDKSPNMLSDQAIDALVRFGEETDDVLVVRALTADQQAELERLLLAWAENPSAKNRKAITDAFPAKPNADL